LSKLIGGFALKTAITVMAVVKRLKAFTLPFQMRIAVKPLAAEKLLTILIVKSFSVASGLIAMHI